MSVSLFTEQKKDNLVKQGTESFCKFGIIVGYETVLKIIDDGATLNQLKEFLKEQIREI